MCQNSNLISWLTCPYAPNLVVKKEEFYNNLVNLLLYFCIQGDERNQVMTELFNNQPINKTIKEKKMSFYHVKETLKLLMSVFRNSPCVVVYNYCTVSRSSFKKFMVIHFQNL